MTTVGTRARHDAEASDDDDAPFVVTLRALERQGLTGVGGQRADPSTASQRCYR